jgi:alpha-amylase/alpha-mannosidase (GH57 family)
MTKVAILWHMHQPYYQDLATGEHILPWARLHALKDYYGMAALLREFPKVRLTFNLVPSLLVQLDAFARDDARDPVLALGLKPARELTDEDRAFILTNFFHAQRTRMIQPYARYAELLERSEAARAAGGRGLRERLRLFSDADFRDLQVWQKLCWIDPAYLEGDPRVQRLVRKDHDFGEDDKLALRAVELELLRKVIPEYGAAAYRNQAELSVSPFYHPILPLVCDTDVYLQNDPHAKLPRRPFRHPEDAAEQLQRAVTCYEHYFGRRPHGLWPSEGSVSDAVVTLAGNAGFRWMATDELILSRSLGRPLSRSGQGLEEPELLYRPYRVAAEPHPVVCLFRDHVLSDLIGFSYAHWSAQDAAQDFIDRLAGAGRRYSERAGGGEATISIILDGENAWEYYEGGGRPFLRALYERLSDHPELRTVTMEEAASGPAERLSTVCPGSWINGDFYIWIGHADDRKAWGQLADARDAYEHAAADIDPAARAQAFEEILIAEGSDWCWWYGEDHSSGQDVEFDDLFRRHLRRVYQLLGKPVPEELFLSNISRPTTPGRVQQPTGVIRPIIDGERSDYFEWLGAGEFQEDYLAGAMHQVGGPKEHLVTGVRFGFDADYLYLRLDLRDRAATMLGPGRVECRVIFRTPPGLGLVIRVRDRVEAAYMDLTPGEHWAERPARDVLVAVDEIVELGIPIRTLHLEPAEPLAWSLVFLQDGIELGRYPRNTTIETRLPSGTL